MKRDWDTIREILLRVEESELDEEVRLDSFPGERAAEISYHVDLLFEAGLVEGHSDDTLSRGPKDFILDRLTWDGHEFLDAVRADTVWNRTKKEFREKSLSMSFDLVKSVATRIAGDYLTG